MSVKVTNLFKQRLAQLVEGVAANDVTPVSARLGTGNYNAGSGVLNDPSANDTNLQNVVLTGIPVTVVRVGSQITVTLNKMPTGTLYNITEAGLFTSDGAMLLIDTFRPIQLPATGGVGITLVYSILGD